MSVINWIVDCFNQNFHQKIKHTFEIDFMAKLKVNIETFSIERREIGKPFLFQLRFKVQTIFRIREGGPSRRQLQDAAQVRVGR